MQLQTSGTEACEASGADVSKTSGIEACEASGADVAKASGTDGIGADVANTSGSDASHSTRTNVCPWPMSFQASTSEMSLAGQTDRVPMCV